MARFKSTIAGLAAVSALFGIGAASAADMAPAPRAYSKAPPPIVSPVYNWSGFYVGVNGGWEQTQASWTTHDVIAVPLSSTSNSGTAGGQVGWLGQWGQFVGGIEASYNGLFGGYSGIVGNTAFPGNFGQSRVNDLLTVTGRAGVAWNQNLLYAKGGWANSQVNLNFVSGPPATANFVTTGTTSGRENGWTAGVGWEYGFAQNWSAALEYDYTRLNIGDRLYTITPGFVCVTTTCGTNAASANIQSVTARLNYHFNWAQPVVARY
jgi:outer membrane immunogenic protein